MLTLVVIASITPANTGDNESSSKDDGVPTAVLAGVGGIMVVIVAVILMVILLIILLVRKNRHQKDG